MAQTASVASIASFDPSKHQQSRGVAEMFLLVDLRRALRALDGGLRPPCPPHWPAPRRVRRGRRTQLVAPSRRRTTSSSSWPPPAYASARARARVTRASSAVRPLLLNVDVARPYGHASLRLCSRVSSVGGSSGRGASNASALAFSARTTPIIGRDCPPSTTNRPTPRLEGGGAAFSCRWSLTRRIRPRSVCGVGEAP